MLGILFTLLMLILLQAVLGFDNLLYISLESKKAPIAAQKKVRKTGILIAIILRIVLLFVLVSIIDFFQEPFSFLSGGIKNVIHFAFNGHSIIVLLGGAFILYTAIKEIWHMIGKNNLSHDIDGNSSSKRTKSSNAVIASIVLMNLVFSFDSILAAIGLTSDLKNSTTAFIVMAIAIVISGLLMLILADKIATFLAKNRMYEVLGLFILFIVGIMLITEGGHLAHIKLFGNEIVPMSKTTFYFILAILIIVDVVQGSYQKKILAENTINSVQEADTSQK
ncbi:TerC family protein [Tenacibaculum piscium]|uniref:Tellurium resistance protein TerC n=1 Tax=Tenacibaculum piscium TaxID=1458515 RepID=A0A2H1YF06_9FLAO|nr:tellurium resistance protein TerC [Tenacibaculum piscium]MBE7628841.1 tellurium resistance protein TerC [Tenacibaculum piscium]MBE7671144.1 tellurium resistance protein TerC [Tenacibaculum piscium]MBE7685137.1 tellurium resistance protein TerC [Tenacibaculum piscium]MBE7689840.1 tellurium resistance protein TerC [Tenacibaculum piscium]MCG8183703.1 tellurium resistance protein TerC [Tenacibaculum piscium]